MTKVAEKLAHRFNVAPVIIKTKTKKFENVLEAIRDVVSDTEGLLIRRGQILDNVFPRIRTIPTFSMISALLPREWIFDLAEAAEVEKIYPNKIMWAFGAPRITSEGIFEVKSGVFGQSIKFTTTLYTKRLIGAFEANQKGFTGSGMKVCVIDTGVAVGHEMLRHAIADTVLNYAHDENGHGTWCCACVAGRYAVDTRLSRKVKRKVAAEGMAPNAWLISIKALGYLVGCGSTDGILKAIEYALMRYNVDVISMSLGGPSEEEKPEDDPYYEVFNYVTERGIIPVVAAGNEGPDSNTICTPGCLPNVLTVGAYDPLTGKVANFSSRGPTNWGDIKPDCIAPGVNIHTACCGLLDRVGDNMRNRYAILSGTSMSTPHVAGLVTLMKQAHERLLGKTLTLDEIMTMLKELGHEKTNDEGYGPITWGMYEEWLATQYSVEI